MWKRISDIVYGNRWVLLLIVGVSTIFMGFQARKLTISYTFTNGIPTSNPVAQRFQKLQNLFGDDASNMVLGFHSADFYTPTFIEKFKKLEADLLQIEGLTSVTSIYNTSDIVASDSAGTKKLVSVPFFSDQKTLDSSRAEVQKSRFYDGLLVKNSSSSFLMLLGLDSLSANSELRNTLMSRIQEKADEFGESTNTKMHCSGLPFIRTTMSMMVQSEMGQFLFLSLLVTSLILIFLFRSVGIWFISILYIGVGIIWGLGIMVSLGYKITLLTALLAPLVVIISVPNIIYFINKYHSSYLESKDKNKSLRAMIEKIGIVTLFTNITTALGFGVFSLTTSQVLHEFGVVAGLTILVLFILAIILLPIFLSFLPAPNERQMKYMQNNWSRRLFKRIGKLILFYRRALYIFVGVTVVLALLAILRLNTVSYIVDDLPHDSRIYRDLMYFDEHFEGVMPLEIVVDAHKAHKVTSLGTLKKMDRLSKYISDHPYISKPISIVEGVKFARQAYYDGEPSGYGLPNNLDISFFAPYLAGGGDENMKNITDNFVDTTHRYARLSFRMKDIGTHAMDSFIHQLEEKIGSIFDPEKFTVFPSGTSVTFLEGSKYIIESLKSSIGLAFIFIFGCIFYLFKNWRILLISIVVNIIPLIITAGVMGLVGIRVKPSTVLVFSIALGITVDMTIRFLVNFKQELEENPEANIRQSVLNTISEAGVSIIFTTFILAAGFGVFMFSSFAGTRALGILIPLTITNAMIANLTVLPALLMEVKKSHLKKMLGANDQLEL